MDIIACSFGMGLLLVHRFKVKKSILILFHSNELSNTIRTLFSHIWNLLLLFPWFFTNNLLLFIGCLGILCIDFTFSLFLSFLVLLFFPMSFYTGTYPVFSLVCLIVLIDILSISRVWKKDGTMGVAFSWLFFSL